MRINRILILISAFFIYFLNDIECAKIPQKRDIFASLFISTGTLWCGKGNIAENCDQLGEYKKTDDCCREHDSCPYTFSSDMSQNFNGYTSHYLSTISHCECDVIFSQCLHDTPYKPHSYEVWESFLSLHVKCFSYLPCSDSDEHQNIWQNVGQRDLGECVNGSRIMVFDSIMDYSDFIVDLKLKQKLEMNKRLITDKDQYMPPNKKKYKCAHSFPNYPEKISANFESEFLKGDADFEFLKKKSNAQSKVELFNEILSVISSPVYVSQASPTMPTTTSTTTTSTTTTSTTTTITATTSVKTHKNEPKTIFLYNIIVPMVVILAIFVFLKVLINVYDKDNL